MRRCPTGWLPPPATSKPVLIDMWATWCKNCLVMDKTTLQDADVTAALAGYVKVKFQAEDPDDPAVAAVMQKLGAKGLADLRDLGSEVAAIILQSGLPAIASEPPRSPQHA